MSAERLLKLLFNTRFLQCARIFIFWCLTALGAQVYYSIDRVRSNFQNSCPLFYERGKGGHKESCILMFVWFKSLQCLFALVRSCLHMNEFRAEQYTLPRKVEIPFRIIDVLFLFFCIFSSVVLTNGTEHSCANTHSDVCNRKASWMYNFRSAQYGSWISIAMWVGANVVNIMNRLVETIEALRKIADGEEIEMSGGTENAVTRVINRSTEVRTQTFLAKVRDQMAAQGMNGRPRVREIEV